MLKIKKISAKRYEDRGLLLSEYEQVFYDGVEGLAKARCCSVVCHRFIMKKLKELGKSK